MYRSSDFSGMYFKVHGLTTLDGVEALSEVPAFEQVRNERVKTIKYFCYLYDAGSPILKRVRDIDKRRQKAAELAGFGPEDAQYVNTLNRLSVQRYRDIVLQMLRAQHNRTFSTIVMSEVLFDECMQKINQIVEMDKDTDALRAMKSKFDIIKHMNDLDEEISQLEAKVFMGDDQAERVVRESGALTPHQIARLEDD